MKLRMHHIELCVSDPNPVAKLFCHQLGLHFVGYRETSQCLQLIFKMEKATFVVTTRTDVNLGRTDNNNYPDILLKSGSLAGPNSLQLQRDTSDAWTLFCCNRSGGDSEDFNNISTSSRCANQEHVDSVFNVAIQVESIEETLKNVRDISNDLVLQDTKRVYDTNSELGYVDYAIIKSCCGNVVHTLVEKSDYQGWFLPGFFAVGGPTAAAEMSAERNGFINMTHFDHFTLACRVGESDEIMDWYERAFGMKRFITNRCDVIIF